MKKIQIILIIIFLGLFIILGARFFLDGNEDSWICENGNWVKHGNPDADMPKSPCPLDANKDSTNNSSQIVGGDRDIHGCIGSAGYSWCEEKQKCLRIWEESCTTSETPMPTID